MVLVTVSFVAAAGPLSAQVPPLPTHALCGTLPLDPIGGCPLWEDRYEGPRAGDDGATGLALSPDGSRAFVSGFSYQRGGGNTYDYVTLAYDVATGDRLWAAEFAGDAGSEDFAMALAVSPDGDAVYVTGMTATGVATIAYDAANGAERWNARYQGAGPGTDIGRDIVASPDGTRVHVLATLSGASHQDVGLLTYDSTTGALLHADVYDGPAGRGDSVFFHSLAVAPDGAVYAAAQSYTDPSTGHDYALLRYDTDGARVGASYYDSGEGGVERPFALGIAPDGSSVYVTGQSRTGASGYDVATVAYDAEGNQLWVHRHDASGQFDKGHMVQVSPDGARVAVVAESVGDDSGYDYLTLLHDAGTGETVWTTRHDGATSGNDVPTAVAFSNDGSRVHVTGRTVAATQDQDATTLTYETASGLELWRHTYAGAAQGNDGAFGLAVVPGSDVVIVTGDSYTDPLGSYDIATFALSGGALGIPLPGPLPV